MIFNGRLKTRNWFQNFFVTKNEAIGHGENEIFLEPQVMRKGDPVMKSI